MAERRANGPAQSTGQCSFPQSSVGVTGAAREGLRNDGLLSGRGKRREGTGTTPSGRAELE